MNRVHAAFTQCQRDRLKPRPPNPLWDKAVKLSLSAVLQDAIKFAPMMQHCDNHHDLQCDK